MPELGPQPTEADPAAEAPSPRLHGARIPGSAVTESPPSDQPRDEVSPWSSNGDGTDRSTTAPSRVAEAGSLDAEVDPGWEDARADGGERDAESSGVSVVSAGDLQDTPRPPSRIRRIVLTSILAVALVGIAVLGWAGWQISSQKNATMTTPPQIAGLHLDNSKSGQDTAEYLQNALSAEVDVDKAVGAVYTDSANHDVLFFGGTTTFWSPGKDLRTAFGLIADDQGAVTNLHDVPAGRYGGTMRCGTTQTDDGPMPVCGWADHGSLALAMFPNRSEADSAKLLLEIRDATQKRK